MEKLNIAVIGSGISGLAAAWLLSERHRVTLYEAGAKLGGHSNTVDVETESGPIAVDTGFIVYNERNYPNLAALFSHLAVATQTSEMTFAYSANHGGYEYSGSGFAGFFGQPGNLLRPSHWQLVADISRFFKTASDRVGAVSTGTTLAEFLTRERYSDAFIEDHIIPMGAAIWSSDAERMLDFPARSFIEFYAQHGMLQFRNRPAWRTVTGGSRSYVERLAAAGGFEVVCGNPIQRVVRRANYVSVSDFRNLVRPFDHVVLATHADQALSLLDEPDLLETRLLGAFRYQRNIAVLHRDPRWMPRRRRLWSSWNYLRNAMGPRQGLCVSYWMNRLQNLETSTNLFVTLNPTAEIHPKAVDGTFDYDHPVFTAEATAAQSALHLLQGRRRTWFCGSYFGYGFHEDGAESGLAVAEALGRARRPWTVPHQSNRIATAGPELLEAAR